MSSKGQALFLDIKEINFQTPFLKFCEKKRKKRKEKNGLSFCFVWFAFFYLFLCLFGDLFVQLVCMFCLFVFLCLVVCFIFMLVIFFCSLFSSQRSVGGGTFLGAEAGAGAGVLVS